MDRQRDRQSTGQVGRLLLTVLVVPAIALAGSAVVSIAVTPSYSAAFAQDEDPECDEDSGRGQCETGPSDGDGEGDGGGGDEEPRQPREGDSWVETAYGSVCTNTPPDQEDPGVDCRAAHNCEEPGDLRYTEWQRTHTYRGGRWVADAWENQGGVCRAPEEDDEVTEEDVLGEIRRFGLRPAVPEAQPPDGETLINLKTIFYTEAEPYTFDLDLGPGVEIRATPERFHWDFGDGEDLDANEEGRPYPDFDIWHEYTETGDVQVTLTVDYRVEWNPGGAGWRTIAETIPGQPSDPLPIEVLESGSVLYE